MTIPIASMDFFWKASLSSAIGVKSKAYLQMVPSSDAGSITDLLSKMRQ